jgi:hypothetical protein
MTKPFIPTDGLTALELKRKISVREAAALNDLSEDTFRRRYSYLIKKISPRRTVVELGDALALPPPRP